MIQRYCIRLLKNNSEKENKYQQMVTRILGKENPYTLYKWKLVAIIEINLEVPERSQSIINM